MYVALFVSRHKDNKEVENFHPRKESRLVEHIKDCSADFHKFVEQGVLGETSRFYISVSERDMNKTRIELGCRLIKEPVNLTNLNPLVISTAMLPQHEIDKKWLFDFDCPDKTLANKFLMAVRNMDVTADIYDTPNGSAIVAEHGFNTRIMLPAWNEYLKSINPEYGIELKRNAMLVVNWDTKW